jgi:hypothetical protein
MSKRLYRQLVSRCKVIKSVNGPRIGHMYNWEEKAITALNMAEEILAVLEKQKAE